MMVKVCGVGLYSFSSSVGWKAGDLAASDVSLAFPFEWDRPQSFALGVSSPVVVPPSHQHYVSSNQPAPVASWLDRLR